MDENVLQKDGISKRVTIRNDDGDEIASLSILAEYTDEVDDRVVEKIGDFL